MENKIPTSHQVSVNLSDSLLNALNDYCEKHSETLDHVIQKSLSNTLGINQHTLYQVSTSTALVQGVYQGCVTVDNIKEHGDFGLGTFDSLNGEGLMLDGKVFQALGDGTVIEPNPTATAPFWVSTDFAADKTFTIDETNSFSDLCSQIDKFRDTQNLFLAIRIDGVFDEIHYRVACKATAGTDLVTATNNQAEFTFNNVTGTLMGFWSPSFARTFNIPGYHLHLLSSDHKHGGHVLGIRAKNLKVQVMDANNIVMALPETPEFLKADLSLDPSAALSKAEGAK